MKTIKKILLLLPAAVLLAAGCSNAQPQVNNQPVPQQQNQQPASGNSQASPTPSSGQAGNIQQNNQQPGLQQDEPINITVYQTVEGSNLNGGTVNAAEGMNALAYLKLTHKVETKSYGSMGEFVESIDGIKPDSKHFWAFYVNGKTSDIGASSYKLKANDKIEWKLELIK